ncbi:unnamed protein product [Rangifer tarandus platyrhynchus]|uniref:Uncharacterized protein n=1 Tax=Rangifer tarandus platyrhynchus TaxID=3082113 RepID=A0AC60A364_RANTA
MSSNPPWQLCLSCGGWEEAFCEARGPSALFFAWRTWRSLVVTGGHYANAGQERSRQPPGHCALNPDGALPAPSRPLFPAAQRHPRPPEVPCRGAARCQLLGSLHLKKDPASWRLAHAEPGVGALEAARERRALQSPGTTESGPGRRRWGQPSPCHLGEGDYNNHSHIC